MRKSVYAIGELSLRVAPLLLDDLDVIGACEVLKL